MTNRYDYACSVCGFLWENVEQSINDAKKRQCPRCKKNGLERLISGGAHAFCRGEIKTLGQLAEKNTREMGKEQQQMKTEKNNEIMTANGFGKKDPINQKLSKMTPEQKRKWIIDGD